MMHEMRCVDSSTHSLSLTPEWCFCSASQYPLME